MERGEKSARAFVKWAGGKQALAFEIASRFPSFRTYYEPFLGGGSVFFALRPGQAALGDANSWLIDAFAAVRDDWRAVACALDQLRNTRSQYHLIRSIDPSTLDPVRRAAHFIYLNKTCFRGLFRVNRLGQFNVPYGAYRRRYYEPGNLELVSKALMGVKLTCADFEFALDGIGADDFAYLDPPYFKLGGYSDFNRYTPNQFRAKDHIRLAAVCRELDHRGVRWAQSNSDTSFVRELYRGFQMTSVAARREINLRSQSRGISELLIQNF
jgi:DNA adenine methylase